MKEDVDRIRGMGNALRTYSSRNGMDEAAAYAQSRGLRVSAGAWLGPERTKREREANKQEIEAVIALAQRVRLESVIVGNEVLLRGDLTAERLAAYIRTVKAKVQAPVTTAEIAGVIGRPEHRVVVDTVDYLMVHIYPYWDGIPIEGAVWYVADVFHQVSERTDKRVVIGETGWPSAGPANKQAQPSLENAGRFLAEWHAVAADQRIDYYYFATADEPWKQEGGVGAHWGILTAARQPKHAMTNLLDPPKPPPRPSASGPTPAASATTTTPSTRGASTGPYPIYTDWAKEDTYVPSGWMGDVDRIGFNDCWRTQPHSGRTSIRIAYSPGGRRDKGWAGIYWQYPENNWGTKPGGKDLQRYRTLTFYARGEHGGERLVFLTGGIPGRHGDTLRRREIAVTLTRAWRKYGIDLRGGDLQRVVGAFGWTAARADNPKGAVFYLDDIQFDTSSPPPGGRLCAPGTTGVREVLDGAHLCPSRSPPSRYEIGVDTSGGMRRWLARDGDAFRMDYPSGQDWAWCSSPWATRSRDIVPARTSLDATRSRSTCAAPPA